MILFFKKHKKIILAVTSSIFILLLFMPIFTYKNVKRNKAYTSKEDVALYLKKYHELPNNYVTYYGIRYMNNHQIPTNEFVVGGDTHINTSELSNYRIHSEVSLKECDIMYEGYNQTDQRGKNRLVYTCNEKKVRVFYTEDHYDTYIELKTSSLQKVSIGFLITFIVYTCGMLAYYIPLGLLIHKKNKNEVTIIE